MRAPEQHPAGQSETPHLLVVEDNPRNRRLVEMVLRKGYRLSFAEDGQEALERVRELRPDLVLLDIQIPKIDGLEVLRHLRADPDLAATRVVALTSYAMPEDRARILAAGCNGYISKPIDTRTLASEVAQHLDRAGDGSES